MIKQADVQARLDERPFRPFLLHTGSGRVHEVRHPEVVWMMPNKVFIAVAGLEAIPSRAIDNYVVLSILHLTEIEPMVGPPALPKPLGNGEVPAAN